VDKKVVTRFAPSPTGYLHIGGARTALFNWLCARRNGGRFLLRIEDTDTRRNSPAAIEQVIKDLRWLGIEWDEGPGVGGPNAPYMQSQRTNIYDSYIKQLIESEKAYYCFDTPDELQAMRAKARSDKMGFVYRRPEHFPDESDLHKAQADGKPITVRFAVPRDKQIVVKDVVRGEVRFASGEIGDFIIRKSDGMPTYHFACVVDDELMQITHVIRGQEHLMNTPGHQALQESLGFRTPVYAHMSVTVSQSGGKLSKRERPKVLREALSNKANIEIEKLAATAGVTADKVHDFIEGGTTLDMGELDAVAFAAGVQLPEINVVDFFKSGYLPEALVNFIALLGWNPGDEREVMEIDELVESFDLSRMTKSNSFFDRDKLVSFNTQHTGMMDTERLSGHFKDYLAAIASPVRRADDKLLVRIIKICEGARTFADIERKSKFVFVGDEQVEYDDKAVKKVLIKKGGLDMLKDIRVRLASMDELSEEGIEDALRKLAGEKGSGLGKVAQPLRVALCGGTVGLPIFESVDILGMKSTLARIDNTLKKFETKS